MRPTAGEPGGFRARGPVETRKETVMGRPRRDTVNPHEVGIYHCWTDCVRQLLLLGTEASREESEPRWRYCLNQLIFLAGLMAVDVLDFSFLSNHIHLLARIRPDLVGEWDNKECARRWLELNPGERPKKQRGKPVTDREIKALLSDAQKMRYIKQQLSSLSFFMKKFKQPIARHMNELDEVRGHFFASRFGCRRIEDEADLLAADIYAVLNPYRAGLGEGVADHPYGSLALRMEGAAQRARRAAGETVPEPDADAWLAPLKLDERAEAYTEVAHVRRDGPRPRLTSRGNLRPAPRASEKGFLSVDFEEYLRLVEWTALHVRPLHRPGADPDPAALSGIIAQLVERLGLTAELWLATVRKYGRKLPGFEGRVDHLSMAEARLRQHGEVRRQAADRSQRPAAGDGPAPAAS